MLLPGDMVTSVEGWDGIPVYDEPTSGFRTPRVMGNLRCYDLALVIATRDLHAFILTSRMEMGWVGRSCLITVSEQR